MELTRAVQSAFDGTEDIQILHKFTLEYTRLKVGAKLLPDLLKLYNWIHRELKCLVDEKYALENGLEEIITKGEKLYPKDGLCTLYDNVTGNKVIFNLCSSPLVHALMAYGSCFMCVLESVFVLSLELFMSFSSFSSPR